MITLQAPAAQQCLLGPLKAAECKGALRAFFLWRASPVIARQEAASRKAF
jgi:hypothetical protein